MFDLFDDEVDALDIAIFEDCTKDEDDDEDW